MKYLNKDITTVTKGIIAHGVNCQGQMGSGVAKAVRTKWPCVYDYYKQMYDDGEAVMGAVQLIKLKPDLYVANLFTQKYYGNDGKVYANKKAVIETIKKLTLLDEVKHLPIYMPKIGCGLGGLNWNNVKDLINSIVRSDRIYVCEIN